jgi:drug/metabolite transporter (DMT)-like permease
MPTTTRRALAGLLLVVLFWGGNFTASKVSLRELDPLAFTAIRFTLGALLLAAVLRRRTGTLRLAPGMGRPMLWLGLVGNTLYQLFFIHGLARTSATNSSLILASMPTVVTVAAGLLGMETITGRRVAGLAVATVGVGAVIAARGFAPGGDHTGDLLMLAAVFCWAAYTIGLRRMGTRMSAFDMTAWTMITGTPLLVLVAVPALLRVEWGAISGAAWAGLGYSTLLSLVAAYVLWNAAVQRLGAGRAAMVSLLTPFVATTIAMLVLHERPGLVHLAGGVLIVSGVVLAQWRGGTPPGRPAQPTGEG